MKRTQKRHAGQSAFDLVEEATHLLRTAPPATLAVYFLGAIPFVLGLLFFWADMSRSPLAPQHLAGASFGLTLLFVWMKFWQAVFARRIRAQATGEKFSPPGFRRCARVLLLQAAIQPSGLFLLPLALLPALPFAWVYAFYQNTTALDDGDTVGTRKFLGKCWKQARLWPKQNHVVLALVLAFAAAVFLNWIVAGFTLPQLFKMLFGVESEFTKNPYAMLNTTFFAAMFGLTYLCVDPVLKTVYALRCFYGESLQSGEDLKAELKAFVLPAQKTAVTIFILLAVFAVTPVQAAETAAPATPPVAEKISPPDLDHVINQTIHERKFVWRMPREQVIDPEAQDGIIATFFKQAGVEIREWARTVRDWIGKILRRLFHHRPPDHAGSESSGYGWILSLQILLYGLVAAVIAALVIFLLRVWRNRHRSPAAVASEPIQPVPDLTDENIRADQLPEDGWTKLARELLERGEFRLAMRAFYLASLSQLAARNLVSIARFKSNRDYERELRRRAHSFPDLLSTFGNNVSVFERIWYGMHEVNGELVHQFADNVERMKAGG